MDILTRSIFVIGIVTSLSLLSTSQTLPPLVIDSDGQMTLGQNFQAKCHLTYTTALSLTVSNMQWSCKPKRPYTSNHDVILLPGGSNFKQQVTLVIERVGCDHDTILCECLLTGFVGTTPVSLNKTLQLNVIKDAETPTLTGRTDNLMEDTSRTFSCTANVGKPDKNLKMYLEHPTKSNVELPVNIQAGMDDANTCLYKPTATSLVTFNRTYNGYQVTCMVEGTNKKAESVELNIQYSVTSVSLKYDNDVISGNMTTDVRAGTYVRLLCESDSNPPPVYEFVFIDTLTNTKNSLTSQTRSFDAQKKDAGTYYCRSTSSLSLSIGSGTVETSVTSHYFTLNVKDPPSTTTTSTTTSSTTVQGGVTGETKDTGSDTGAIVGGVVGGLLALIIIALCVFCYKRRNNKGKQPSSKPTNNLSPVKEREPDLYSSHKTPPAKPGTYNSGYNKQDDYLNHIPMSTEGRSRNPVMLNDDPYTYSSPYPGSQYSHSRPV